MPSRISSAFLRLVLVLIFDAASAQEIKNVLEFGKQLPFHIFSDKANKISGYATGKYLAYNIGLLNNLGLNSFAVVFDYKDLHRINNIEKLGANQFGNAYALIGILNFSLVNRRGLRLIFSPGIGFGYLDETWYTNKNPIIKSHLNFASLAAVKLSYEINRATKILTSLNILHFSNAAIRVPNHGLNIIGLNLGIARNFVAHNNKRLKLFDLEVLNFRKRNVELGINIGGRGVYNSKKVLYKSGVYLGYEHLFNSWFGINIGIDGVYYYSLFDLNRYVETYQSKATSFDRWRIGVGTGPTLSIGNFSFTALHGYYLHYQNYIPIYTYWNTSIKVKLKKWISVQAKLYAHSEEVDFLGLGFVFNKLF